METKREVTAIRLDERDTVVVLVETAEAGDVVVLLGEARDRTYRAEETIPYGHKMAIESMPAGAPVIKYGEKMGITTRPIAVGCHVHEHNVRGLEREEREGVRHANI